MKRILVAAAVVLIAVAAYRYVRSHGPEAHYKTFAEEILHRRYAAAARMADGLSENDLQALGSQERIGSGPAMFQTLFPSRFRIESTETEADGMVRIHATQTVLFNPAGVESAVRPAMFATLKQVVGLRKRSGDWKVVSFENEFETMDSTSGR